MMTVGQNDWSVTKQIHQEELHLRNMSQKSKPTNIYKNESFG